jgi:hypothetical protein
MAAWVWNAATIRDKMGHLLNPVFRSIAPQNNNPKTCLSMV